MNRELLQQAHDALLNSTPKPADDDYCERGWKEREVAITALRSALAAPQPGPVAWRIKPMVSQSFWQLSDDGYYASCKRDQGYIVENLYAAPPAAPAPAVRPDEFSCPYCFDQGAAPAVPEGEIVITKDEDGVIVSVTRQNEEGRIISVLAESAAPAAPQPEPVAWAQNPKYGFWCWCLPDEPGAIALYAAPPAAPAPAVPAVAVPFPLTAQEIKDIARSTGHVTHDQAWEIADLLVGGVVSAAPAVPDWDKTLRGAARRSATVVHPGKLAAPAVREPLTQEQTIKIFLKSSGYGRDDFISFARAIEQAHGIGGGGK